ncbi:Ada metal-binding domain-containing protein [Fulvivirga ligni]|uniref:Ada metal-binding domain-containing protein n=1 Tax=Fulvivirga ligni TaxID=2904246 RepID=UPI001F445480|nr:Ada metal-binding domain-containing protein [Fulvivirga ligni]UII23779.1 metal-binding protein [Fulvivirga ligni]
MLNHSSISKEQLFRLIKSNEIQFAGNKKLKIYGTLQCKSGKRMKHEYRVFFLSEEEAREQGYRPCGHCMREFYQLWKYGSI